MDRAERRRLAKEDAKLLERGLNPESKDPNPIVAMARSLHSLLDDAKRTKNIDPVVSFYHAKIDATVKAQDNSRIACRKGCSFCCRVWVSATAPEIFYIAKVIKQRDESVAASIAAAHALTGDLDPAGRSKNPHPCPLLIHSNCSIYEHRPKSCRLGVSYDAELCERAFMQGSGEEITMPQAYLVSRTTYAAAFFSALKHAGLSYANYELNAGLSRALEREDAEAAWLGGEDVFSGVAREPGDVFDKEEVRKMYQFIFGRTA